MEKLEKEQSVKLETLRKYATDLTNMAQKGKLDPLVGREQQLERVMQILCKRRKNNPCLLGDPGVGKTVIVEGLAQRIVNSSSPFKLQGKKVLKHADARTLAWAACVNKLWHKTALKTSASGELYLHPQFATLGVLPNKLRSVVLPPRLASVAFTPLPPTSFPGCHPALRLLPP
ncbi:hypothetical protein CUMW_192930, partial [Citrus unshiu]